MAEASDPLATADGGGSVTPLGGGSTEPAAGPFTSPFPTFDQANAPELTPIQVELAATIAECESTLGTVDQLITSSISQCNEQCRLDAAGCGACVLGAIERDTTLGAETIARCWTRIADHVNATVKEMYQTSIAAGVTPPTADQLEAALSGLPIPEPAIPAPGETFPVAEPFSAVNPVALAGQPVVGQVSIPEGATRPILDLTGTFLTCPETSQPYPAQNSPTGFLQDSYIPVHDETGRLVYCRIETHVALPPTSNGGGGVPPVGGGTGGNGGGTTSPPTNGQGTLPPVVPVPPEQSPPGFNCPEGSTLFASTARDVPVQIPPGWESAGLPGFDDGTRLYQCAVPSSTQPPPAETPPPTPPEPLKEPPSLTVCDPTQLGKAVADFTSGTLDNVDIGAMITAAFGIGPGYSVTSFIDLLANPGKFIGNFLSGVINTAFSAGQWFISPGLGAAQFEGSCRDNFQLVAYATHGVTNFINRIFGFIPQQTLISQLYGINYRCQYLIPSASQAVAAYSRDYLTKEQAEFLWKCEGQCVPWQQILTDAAKTRIGIQDAYRLFRLGLLDSSEFFQSWRRQGIDVENDLDKWYETVKQYPGMADLVRMMVRDIGDDRVVAKLGLDTGFENKWSGELQTWGKAQGVEDEVARSYWRAHWQSPSPQQIFTWLQRLRPDDRDPNDQFSSVVVTSDDARDFLQIADYVPGLVDAYIATAYRPYTRVDIRRLWRVGTFTKEEEVRRAYRDLGSDAEHADKLAKFTIESERTAKAKLAGSVPAAEIAKSYQQDLLSLSDAINQLDIAGLSQSQVNATIRSADLRRDIASRKSRLQSLKRRYFMGEFDDAAIGQELQAAGVSVDAAQRLAVAFREERKAKAKQPTVAMLCKWFGEGLIDLTEYFRRVRNLNYNEVDANRIILTCQGDIAKRREAEIEKEQARVAKIAQQQIKEAAKAAAAARRANREQRKTERMYKNGRFTGRFTDTRTVDVNEGLQVVEVDQTTTTQ